MDDLANHFNIMDSPRTAMSTTQAKHMISVAEADPLLMGNGSERAMAHLLSNDFAFKAKEDGEVIEKNEKLELVVVKYKSGDVDVIDISSRIAKNGGGGFYISNKLNCNLQVGDKFKQGDIIAKNDQFFTDVDSRDISFNSGTLAKIAIYGGYYTYEDTTMVTNALCEKLTSQITQKKSIPLGKNSNVDYIVKKGQKVKVGDPLIIFDQSFKEAEINKFLSSVGDALGEEIKQLGKVPIKSKYSGVIEDVVIYYNVDESELSESLRDIITENNNKIGKAKKLIKKYTNDKSKLLSLPPDHKVNTKYDKIDGIDVDGVLINIYIKYDDILGVGDKINFFAPLKSIICDVIPKGKEPYALSRPDEEISAFLAPISVEARMTASIKITMFVNKVLIELKRAMADIAK